MHSIATLVATLASEARGSVGDRVFSRNPFGPYNRARTAPTGLPSFAQIRIRNLMTAASARWASLAADVERPFWNRYARLVHRHNALGQPFIDQGRNWFIGADVLRHVAYFTTIFKAPREYRRTSLTPFTVRYFTLTDILRVSFEISDEWHNHRDSLLILFQSHAVPPTTFGRCRPYRYLGFIRGDQASPANFRPIFPIAPGQAFFVRGVALNTSNYMSRSHWARGYGF